MTFKEFLALEGASRIKVLFRDPADGHVDDLESWEPGDDWAGFLSRVRQALEHPEFRHYEHWAQDESGRRIELAQLFGEWTIIERRSEFEVLKQNKEPLEGEEREKAKAMQAGCVWHFNDSPSCAIFKARDSQGQIWYMSNTHRAYDKSKTLSQAIKRFHSYVKPSA